jgi:hypothetical protein
VLTAFIEESRNGIVSQLRGLDNDEGDFDWRDLWHKPGRLLAAADWQQTPSGQLRS